MDDPGSSMYLGALFCLILSAYFSGSETAIFSSDEIRLKSLFGHRKGLDKVLALRSQPEFTLSFILLGNTIVNIMFASLITTIVHSLLTTSLTTGEMISTLLGTALVLVFGEITPKLLATANPERMAVSVSGPLDWLGRVMSPLTVVLRSLATAFARVLPKAEARSEELIGARLMAAIDYGENSGLIRNDEKEMIYGVIEAQELEVSDVMVPRPQVIALPEDRSALEALTLMLRFGFSRLPLYAESKDNTTGIVTVKDLADFVGANGDDWRSYLASRPARSFARPPHFVPETKRVSDLLYEMRSSGIYMSIVVDEYDGVSGIVTLEDLIEEIVGEIHDEYDPGDKRVVVLGQGVWQVPGSMSLVDLEDSTGLTIEDEESDTVAGLVMRHLERVPSPGDGFCLLRPKVCLEVKEVRGPRIQKVVITAVEEEQTKSK